MIFGRGARPRRWSDLAESRVGALACGWLAALLLAGCEQGPAMAPVSGKVLYNGEPLKFGSVTFQPPSGQAARGKIQSDGTYSLSTYQPGDGAVVGHHKVRITCYESQGQAVTKDAGEQTLGKLLIPERYTFFDQSGLTAEVRAGQSEPIDFELSDR